MTTYEMTSDKLKMILQQDLFQKCTFKKNIYLYRMSKSIKRPLFNKRIFWDVDYERLDYNERAAFVIERVFNRGDVEDVRQCRRYYGDDKIKQILLSTKFIADHRLHLISAIIDEPLSAFRCYSLKQLNPTLYPY